MIGKKGVAYPVYFYNRSQKSTAASYYSRWLAIRHKTLWESTRYHQAYLSGRGFLGLPQKRHLRHDRNVLSNDRRSPVPLHLWTGWSWKIVHARGWAKSLPCGESRTSYSSWQLAQDPEAKSREKVQVWKISVKPLVIVSDPKTLDGNFQRILYEMIIM